MRWRRWQKGIERERGREKSIEGEKGKKSTEGEEGREELREKWGSREKKGKVCIYVYQREIKGIHIYE